MGPGHKHRQRADRAFERLYRRHVDDVYRYALAVLANRSDAEDVTQTTFLNAYRGFETMRHSERSLNWLIAIAHNVCRQRFRDAARRPREVELDLELVAPAHDDGARVRSEDIRRAFSQLSFAQRSALAMRELEGRSYAEIADVLGITVSAVETLIFRARRAFREQLEGALTCNEAEAAISRQLDEMATRGERAALRAHLRACDDCAGLARRFRAQRSWLRGVVFVPLPQSLSSFTAAGGAGSAAGAAVGGGLAIKAVTLGAVALVVSGVGTEAVRHATAHPGAASVSKTAGTPPRAADVVRAQPVSLGLFSPAAAHAAATSHRAGKHSRRVHDPAAGRRHPRVTRSRSGHDPAAAPTVVEAGRPAEVAAGRASVSHPSPSPSAAHAAGSAHAPQGHAGGAVHGSSAAAADRRNATDPTNAGLTHGHGTQAHGNGNGPPAGSNGNGPPATPPGNGPSDSTPAPAADVPAGGSGAPGNSDHADHPEHGPQKKP